ncbi:MAG: DUF5808 domain-containing protein [Bacteroidota bacterium]|jgi:uncharacterized membrane protein
MVTENEPKNWKLGIIYFNPDDPRSMVPKSAGIGWTLNFARPIAKIVFSALLCFVILCVICALAK